tara:strand:- start:601 stop:1980 length:1380 start_codon:yes stop_codon:yes gene_type:complete
MAQIFKNIPIQDIKMSPDNLRKTYTLIEELAQSIRFIGLLEPMVVMKEDEGYLLVAGHRRYLAILALIKQEFYEKSYEIKCIVHSKMTSENLTAAMLIENMQRVDLTPVEEAQGVIDLAIKHQFTEAEIAQSLGVSKAWVKERIAIHGLPDFIKDIVGERVNIKSAVMLAGLPSDVRDRLTKDNKIPSQYDIEDRHNKELSSSRALTLFNKLTKAGHLVTTEAELKTIIAADVASLSGTAFAIKSIIGGATGIKANYWEKPETPMVELERVMANSHDFTLDALYVLKKVGGFSEWCKAKLYVPLSMAKDQPESEKTKEQIEDDKYHAIEDTNDAMTTEWSAACRAVEAKYVSTIAKPAEMIAILLNDVCDGVRPAFRARQCSTALEMLGLSVVEDHEANWEKFKDYKNKNAANLARAAFAAELPELRRIGLVPVEYPPEPTYLMHEDEAEADDPFEETA